MTKIFVARIRKITNLILVSSIVSLTLVSILPCFAEDINGEILYYNIEAVKNSNNPDIQALSNTLDLIVICNWILILFSILSFIGLILIVSKKYLSISKVIMLIICANIIFSALTVSLSLILIKDTGNIDNARTPFILSDIIINYQYFPSISSAVSFLGSILYLISVPRFYFKDFLTLKKRKKNEEKQFQKKKTSTKSNKDTKIVVEKSTSQKIAPVIKSPSEPTEKESYEGYIQEDHADSELYPAPERRLQTKKESPPEKEESIDVKGPYEKTFQQESETDVPKEEYPEKKEQQIPSPFEKALSSAVEKRHLGTNKNGETREQPTLKKKLAIRCPECKNIFTVEKEEGVFETKIECPKCGRKGVIKN